MKHHSYDFAKRAIETTNIKRRGLLLSALNLRTLLRASRGYGSMKSYFVRNH